VKANTNFILTLTSNNHENSVNMNLLDDIMRDSQRDIEKLQIPIPTDLNKRWSCIKNDIQ
jgi:hypothetical protein